MEYETKLNRHSTAQRRPIAYARVAVPISSPGWTQRSRRLSPRDEKGRPELS